MSKTSLECIILWYSTNMIKSYSINLNPKHWQCVKEKGGKKVSSTFRQEILQL